MAKDLPIPILDTPADIKPAVFPFRLNIGFASYFNLAKDSGIRIVEAYSSVRVITWIGASRSVSRTAYLNCGPQAIKNLFTIHST